MSARATPTRTLGLGDLGHYVDDDSNVLQYPSLIGKYAHFAYIDLGGPAGTQPALPDSTQVGLNAGAFVRLGENFQLGLATSDFSPFEQNTFLGAVSANAANAGNAAAFKALQLAAVRRFDLFVGYSLTKDMGLGLRLAYGSNSQTFVPDASDKTTDPMNPIRAQDTQSQRQFQATLAFSAALSHDFGFDVALDLLSYGLTNQKNNLDTFNGGGGTGVGLSARAHLALTSFWSLIPQLTYRGSSFAVDELFTIPAFGAANSDASQPLPAHEKRNHSGAIHNLDVGVMAALQASKIATFWIGPGFQLTKSTYGLIANNDMLSYNLAVSTTQYALPYVKFAFEVAPVEWVRLRGGAEKYTYSSDWSSNLVNNKGGTTVPGQGNRSSSGTGGIADGTTGAINSGAPDFMAYLGVSFYVLNGFGIDFLLDNELLKSGFSGLFANKIAVRGAVSYKF